MGKPNPLGGSWCQKCNVFVKDHPIEKKNHETSFKHQNNIQKALRQLHKSKEHQDRDAERAKAEVARLNKLSGKPDAAPNTATASRSQPRPRPAAKAIPAGRPTAAAMAEDRKRQLEQLVGMGVAVPDEYRSDMAMAGGWTTVSETVVRDSIQPKADGSGEEESSMTGAFGVRKRKAGHNGEDSDDEHQARPKHRWGTAIRAYPGRDEDLAEDLDTLLAASASRKPGAAAIKSEEPAVPSLEKSESEEEAAIKAAIGILDGDGTDIEPKEGVKMPVFKKRKALKR